jgi:hypothetical protein
MTNGGSPLNSEEKREAAIAANPGCLANFEANRVELTGEGKAM